MKETIARIVILFIGLTIAHLGVTMFLLANLGADPFNVLIQGLLRLQEHLFNFKFITHGKIHMCISLLIILVLLFVDRSYIKIGTIICMIFGGPIIDVFSLLLSPIITTTLPIFSRIIVNIIGCAILAYGMTIVIKSNAGTGPNDLVALVISEKLNKKFSLTRVSVDISFALSGFLLGGTIGIGTIICAFVVGPVAGFFMPFNERLINKILNKI